MRIIQYFKHSVSTRDISTVCLIVGLFIVCFLPSDFLFHNTNSFCIHKNILHFDCPGCGMTRALYLTLHGNFRQALMFNIAITPFIILIIQHFLSYVLSSKLNDIFRKISISLFTVVLFTQYFIKTLYHFL